MPVPESPLLVGGSSSMTECKRCGSVECGPCRLGMPFSKELALSLAFPAGTSVSNTCADKKEVSSLISRCVANPSTGVLFGHTSSSARNFS